MHQDQFVEQSQMCIVTGPNIDMAIKLIKTIEEYF